MNNTIRATAVDALGETDETVAPKGAVDDIPGALGAATGIGLAPRAHGRPGRAGARGPRSSPTASTGAIVEQVAAPGAAARGRASRASSSSRPIRHGWTGSRRSSAPAASDSRSRDLRPGEVYLNREGRREAARRGRRRGRRLRGKRAAADALACATSSASTAPARPTPSMLVPLAAAQQLFGHPGEIRAVLISNRGGATAGAALTDDVVAQLDPLANRLGLEVTPVKQDAIDDGRRDGRRVHRVLHDVRDVLDRGGHPADLPHLRHARGRAARRARHRPRDRHAPRPPRRDVHVRGRRLRPPRRCGRRAARCGRRLRHGARDGAAPSAPPTPTRGCRSQFAVSWRSLVDRVRDRAPAHARRRRGRRRGA